MEVVVGRPRGALVALPGRLARSRLDEGGLRGWMRDAARPREPRAARGYVRNGRR
jgi:hypothetical protein